MGKSSMASCVVNLSNTIVGAGILGLPHAFSESGGVVGMILLVMAAAGSLSSLHMLAVSAETVGIYPSSFYTVANASIPRFTKFIDLAVTIKCFGVGTSYLIVIGDLMPAAMQHLGYDITRTMSITIAFFTVLPLAFLRSLDSLKFTSTVALFCVSFVVGVTVVFTFGLDAFNPCNDVAVFEPGCGASNTMYAATSPQRTLRVLTIFIFSYTCQQNIFAICSDMRNATLRKVDKVIRISVVSCMTLYIVVAVAGFYSFGDGVKADILTNYPQTSLVTFSRIAISILVTCSYPLQAHPARNCALSLYASVVLGEDDAGNPKPTDRSTFYVVAATYTAGSYLCALYLEDLGIVLQVVGATGSTMVSYILPGAIYWTLHPHPHLLRWVAAFQFIFGFVIMPLAIFYILDLGTTLGDMFDPHAHDIVAENPIRLPS